MPIHVTIIQIVVAVGFVAAGLAKLLGAKPIAEQFKEFGLPRYAMYIVGVLELAGAAGVFLQSVGFLASIGLCILMLGAIGQHLKVKHPFSMIAPSVLLLTLSGALAAFLYQEGFWVPLGYLD